MVIIYLFIICITYICRIHELANRRTSRAAIGSTLVMATRLFIVLSGLYNFVKFNYVITSAALVLQSVALCLLTISDVKSTLVSKSHQETCLDSNFKQVLQNFMFLQLSQVSAQVPGVWGKTKKVEIFNMYIFLTPLLSVVMETKGETLLRPLDGILFCDMMLVALRKGNAVVVKAIYLHGNVKETWIYTFKNEEQVFLIDLGYVVLSLA